MGNKHFMGYMQFQRHLEQFGTPRRANWWDTALTPQKPKDVQPQQVQPTQKNFNQKPQAKGR